MIATAKAPPSPAAGFRARAVVWARRSWPWLRVLVAVGILAVLGWRLGTGAFVTGLRVITGPSVMAALGIGFVTTLCAAWRWCLVARGLGLPLKLWTAVSDVYRSLLLNSVLPAGVLGDVHRAVNHGRLSGDLGRGVRAVVLERFGGQVVLAVVGITVLTIYPSPISMVVPGNDVAIGAGVLLLAVVALGAWLRWASPRARRVVATMVADMRVGLLSPKTWPGVALLSAVNVGGHLLMFVVAARVAGLTAPVTELLPILVLTLMVMGLPVNIGGWGPREGFSAFAFGAAGLGATEGLTVAVVYGVLSLVACAPGAAVLFFGRRRNQDSRGISPESRIATYSANDSTRLASRALPLAAEASDGRPITPESV